MAKYLHEEITYSTDFHIINSPAFYDCCLHLIADSGTGSFTYNGKSFSLNAGDIAVISQPRNVSDITSSDNFSCSYIAAPEKFLHNLLPANNYSIQGSISLFDNPVIKVSAEDAERFRFDLHNIRQRSSDIDHRFYQEMISGLLVTMVYDLFDFHSKVNDSTVTTDRVGYITGQFFSMVRAGKPKTEREVSYYADQLSVTTKYLSDTIKRVTGLSASAHINRAAVAIILTHLKDNKMSVTQIADAMNFSSVSYFSRYCVKHLGNSPAHLRKADVKNL